MKIIEAAGRVIAEKGVDGTNISDITDAADVGIGSFYNHFESKAAIAELIFLEHADELAKLNAVVFDRESDPARAIAYIQKIFLTKAVADSVWGWFVVHATTDMPQMTSVFAQSAKEHLRLAQAAGRFHPADLDVSVRLILLALIGGMRDLLEGKVPENWGDLIVQSLLQMLGLGQDEARALSCTPLPAYVTRLFSSTPVRETRQA